MKEIPLIFVIGMALMLCGAVVWRIASNPFTWNINRGELIAMGMICTGFFMCVISIAILAWGHMP